MQQQQTAAPTAHHTRGASTDVEAARTPNGARSAADAGVSSPLQLVVPFAPRSHQQQLQQQQQQQLQLQQDDATLESIINRASTNDTASMGTAASQTSGGVSRSLGDGSANSAGGGAGGLGLGGDVRPSSSSPILDQTVHARQAISPWLHFRDPRLEDLFLADCYDKYVPVVRRSIIIATVLWVLFVINDIIKNGEGKRRYFGATLSLRFGAMALVVGALLVTYSSRFGRRGLSWLVAAVVILFGSAQILSGVIEKDTIDPTYSVAVVLISSTSSAFFRLPCWASISTNTAMYALYVLLTGATGSYNTGTHFGTTCMWLAIGVAIFSLHAYDREWYIRSSFLAQRRLEYEEHKSQRVLLQMLPASVITELRSGAEFMHERHSNISVLFSHICDFDEHTSSMSPAEVIGLLNRVFSRFDQITDEWRVYKVETVGDVYLISAGVPEPRVDHANALAHVAVSMMEALPEFQSEERLLPVQLQIGIHSGPVIAGVVGMKYPRFRLMGDTVNTASRMSSTCAAGDIQLSPSAFQQLRADQFIVQYRGEIDVKGKGRMKTYLVRGRTQRVDALVAARRAAALAAATPSMRGLGSTYTPRTPITAAGAVPPGSLADTMSLTLNRAVQQQQQQQQQQQAHPSPARLSASKWTEGFGMGDGSAANTNGHVGSMRLTDPTRLLEACAPQGQGQMQGEWTASNTARSEGVVPGAAVVASATDTAETDAPSKRSSMRIQLPGHRSFMDPSSGPNGAASATTTAATAAASGTVAAVAAIAATPAPSSMALAAPLSLGHLRANSAQHNNNSASAVASTDLDGGVMLEDFSVVPDFTDAAASGTPLATDRTLITQADQAASAVPPPLSLPPSARDGGGGADVGGVVLVGPGAAGGVEPSPGDHVQPTGEIGPNEVTRLVSCVGKGGRHALVKHRSVVGNTGAAAAAAVAAAAAADMEEVGDDASYANGGVGGGGTGAPPSALASMHNIGNGALASGVGSVVGGVGSGSKDILRITAKEVQRGGGGNGGLFSSSMDWDTLVDARNPFNLRFVHDPELEAQFQAEFFGRFLEPNRRGLLSFVVALLLLGIYETLLNLPDSASESRTMQITWILRAVGLAVGVALYTFTYTHRLWYQRWQQPILTATWAVMGCMLLTILVQLDSYSQVYGVTSVLLLLTMTSTFVGLQFLWVALVTVFFLLWYLGSALVVYQTFPLMVFFLLASNVLAITAARSSEYYLRWDFIRHLKLQMEERRTRHFLDNMLPRSVIAEIKQLSLDAANAAANAAAASTGRGGGASSRGGGGGGGVGGVNRFIAHEFQHASVLFSDIVSFTSLAARIRPEDVVAILNVMFSTFDALTTKHNVFKVETIGDAYLACSGVVHRSASQTEDLVKFALDLQTSTKYMQTPDGQPIVIRIGIHTGSVVAGVVGRKMPRYHLFGETVTISEEMEQNGIPGAVVISAATHAECAGFFQVERLEPITLHAKPNKNVVGNEANGAAQVAPLPAQTPVGQQQQPSAASMAAPSSYVPFNSDGVSCSSFTCDESRLVHRYKVLCHLGSMAPQRGGGGGNTVRGGGGRPVPLAIAHPSAVSISGAVGGGLLLSSPSSASSRPGTRAGAGGSHSRPSSAAAIRAEELDRAPPPFVAQILGRINAKNFADNHDRLERNQEKIRSALEAAQVQVEAENHAGQPESKPAARSYDATNVLTIYPAGGTPSTPQQQNQPQQHASPTALFGRAQ